MISPRRIRSKEKWNLSAKKWKDSIYFLAECDMIKKNKGDDGL